MLFDPRWDQHTLDQWIEWLETKDPSQWYDWNDSSRCACAQFYGKREWGGQLGYTILNKIARGPPRDDAITLPGDEAEWMFGKCLERAKRYRDEILLTERPRFAFVGA